MKQLLLGTTAYRSIRAEAERGEPAQATLVVFPDGKYLRALLKECAKAFFCAEEGTRTAELIDKEIYSDCLFFPAEGGKLTAEHCVRIVEEGMLRPVEGERKLFVLDAFDTAAPLVQNKLLKSLEEPPAGVHFLLGAQSEYPVLPTVLSRVKKYETPPFSEEQIASALKRKFGGETEAAASASGGIFSVGESLLGDGGEEFRLAERFLSLENTETFCREMGEYKNRREFFAALKALLKDILFLGTGQERYARTGSERARALAREFPTGAALRALALTEEAEKQIQFNAGFASCLYRLALAVKEEKYKWQRLS